MTKEKDSIRHSEITAIWESFWNVQQDDLMYLIKLVRLRIIITGYIINDSQTSTRELAAGIVKQPFITSERQRITTNNRQSCVYAVFFVTKRYPERPISVSWKQNPECSSDHRTDLKRTTIEHPRPEWRRWCQICFIGLSIFFRRWTITVFSHVEISSFVAAMLAHRRQLLMTNCEVFLVDVKCISDSSGVRTTLTRISLFTWSRDCVPYVLDSLLLSSTFLHFVVLVDSSNGSSLFFKTDL